MKDLKVCLVTAHQETMYLKQNFVVLVLLQESYSNNDGKSYLHVGYVFISAKCTTMLYWSYFGTCIYGIPMYVIPFVEKFSSR